MMKSLKNRETSRILLVGLLGAIFLIFIFSTLHPYLTNGYYVDDSLNCQLPVKIDRLNTTIWQFMVKSNLEWMSGAGRFFPLTFLYGHWIEYTFGPPYIRLVHVISIFFSISLYFYFVFQWTRSLSSLLLLPPLLAILFQMVPGFDPMAAYPAFLQSVAIYGFSSIHFQWKYFRTGKISYLFLSAFLAALNVLTYEVGVIFIPILIFLVWSESSEAGRKNSQKKISKNKILNKIPKEKILRSIPYLIVGIAYCSVIYYLRVHRSFVYGAIEPRFKYKPFRATLYYQTVAAFPLNYFRAQTAGYFDLIKSYGFQSIWTHLSVFTGMILFYVGLGVAWGKDKVATHFDKSFFIVALGTLLLPGVLMGLSAGGTVRVGPGTGYIPVYISYFGTSMLLFFFLFKLPTSKIFSKVFPKSIAKNLQKHSPLQTGLKLCLTVGLGAILFICHSSNQHIVRIMDAIFKVPRTNLENAYSFGLADKVIQGSTIVTANNYIWNNNDLSFKISKTVSSVEPLEYLETKVFTHPYYYLRIAKPEELTENKGWAFLAQIQPPSEKDPVDRKTTEVLLKNALIYVNFGKMKNAEMAVLCKKTLLFREALHSTDNAPTQERIIPTPEFRCALDHVEILISFR